MTVPIEVSASPTGEVVQFRLGIDHVYYLDVESAEAFIRQVRAAVDRAKAARAAGVQWPRKVADSPNPGEARLFS